MVSQEFGHQLIGPQEHLKKATIILNPAACKGYDYKYWFMSLTVS